MNLAQLSAKANEIRRKPITHETRTELDALRVQADDASVRAQFDAALAHMFRDVFGGKPVPTVSVTSMGTAANNATAGGTRGSAALAFHGAHDPKAIADAVRARIPELVTTTPPPMHIDAQFAPQSAADRTKARDALEAELGGVMVHASGTSGTSGDARVSLLDKLEKSGLPADRLLDVLSQVKVGYDRVKVATGDHPPDYQDVNWKHTRLELDRVLDVVAAKKLSPREAEIALYASFLSDACKTPSNFLVHNVHGAQAAVHVLSRLVPPVAADMIEDVARTALEHQIGPPKFMAYVMVKGALGRANTPDNVTSAIAQKIANPFDPKNLTADRTQIAFSREEKEALAKIGVFAWTVPHEGSRHYRASRSVIDADSLVNYACPDGWAKIAALHGPDQPLALRDSYLIDSLTSQKYGAASARTSFSDARSVVSPDVLPMYDAGLARTEGAIGRVMTKLRAWVDEQADESVARTFRGEIPYLDGELNYTEPAQVAFARSLRDEAVRLLRAEETAS